VPGKLANPRRNSARIWTAFLLSICWVFAANYARAQATSNLDAAVTAVDDHIASQQRNIIGDFVELLALPNVADNLPDMERNAAHIMELLERRGFSTRRLAAGGAPYVFAELNVDPALDTLLIYAHFDGQPVMEADWAYPPFSPTLLTAPVDAGGVPVPIDTIEEYQSEWRLQARSAGDDKMPVIALIHALDALTAAQIPLSVNLKLFLDGEEERGSPTINRIFEEYEDLFEADLILFCDGPMHQSRRTQIVFGVRGITGLEMTVYGAGRPLHDGHYGNWSPNPIVRLSHLLASMRDETGRILIEGFYDDIVPLSEMEIAAIGAMPDMTSSLQDEFSIHTPEGAGQRLEEAITLPALNVRGFVAGGVGEEAANVIVTTARASLDFRLVPNETPDRVRELVEAHMREQGYFIVYENPSAETLRSNEKVIKLDWRFGSPAVRAPMDDPATLDFTNLMRAISPDLIITPTMGATAPIGVFDERLSAPIVILPLSNHDNNQHAENESLRLQNLWDAIEIYGVLFSAYGAVQ